MATHCRLDGSTSYDHPAYKKLSALNGAVNKMTREEIRAKLKDLHLDYRGHRDIISRRLKKFYKEQQLVKCKLKKYEPSSIDTFYDFILIIDFEATCEETNQKDFRNEIIEFPICLLNTRTLRIEAEFHEYCRPMLNRVLTDFCISLTGIEQETIDAADTFPVVLQHVDKWMLDHNLFKDSMYNYVVATDGPWDMAKFMKEQCELCGIEVPSYAKKWINIRKVFGAFYQLKRGNIQHMLTFLDLKFEGRQHSGLDDSRNISRIVCKLLEDGCKLRVNEHLKDFKDYVWFGGRVADRSHAQNNDVIIIQPDQPDDGSRKQGLTTTTTTASHLVTDIEMLETVRLQHNVRMSSARRYQTPVVVLSQTTRSTILTSNASH